MTEIAALEQAAYDTWTADETTVIDGWTLHATDGFTRRVNCARAEGSPSTSMATRDRIAAWLTQRGGAGVVRVTPLLSDETRDAVAQSWGYQPRDRTLVMVAPATGAYDESIRLVDVADRGFFDDINELNDRRDTSIPAWQRVLSRVRRRAAGIWVPGKAAGLAVHAGEYAGVYSVAVRPDARRQAIASRMMDTASAWAQDRGASTMFLQVQADNHPALGLYQALGYRTVYEYSYLQEPAEAAANVVDGC